MLFLDILSSILQISPVHAPSVAKASFCFVEHVEQDLSVEFINIFQYCACNSGNYTLQNLLDSSIANTQLNNIVPGASPSQPLKTKQTFILAR